MLLTEDGSSAFAPHTGHGASTIWPTSNSRQPSTVSREPGEVRVDVGVRIVDEMAQYCPCSEIHLPSSGERRPEICIHVAGADDAIVRHYSHLMTKLPTTTPQ